MDARIRYTKMRIREALIQLLNLKSVKRISVKEVCELAEINRATFYKHYMDIFDLLDKLKEEQVEAIFAATGPDKSSDHQPEETEEEPTDQNDETSKLVQLLTKVSLSGGMIKLLGSENGDPLFFKQITEQLFEATLNNQLVLKTDKEEKVTSFLQKICVAATSEIIANWVENDMETTAESVAWNIERMIGALRAEYAPETIPVVFANADVERQANQLSQDEIKGNTGLFNWIRKALS